MKISLALLPVMLFLPGCLDIWITTQIRPDGSISQTIVFQGDSTEIAEAPFALMKEEGWKKEWTIPEKDKYKLVVSKEFSSVKELNKTMNPSDTNQLVIRINSSLQRKFRWFFTRFEYEADILVANPFNYLDYKKYFTDEEVRLLALNEDRRKNDPAFDSLKYKDTEERFAEYIFRNMYEDFYRQVLSILSEDKTLTLTRQELDTKKDDIYRFLIDSLKGDSPDDILGGFDHIVNHPDFQLIRSKYLNRFDDFQKRNEFHSAASDDSYKFTIRMPGLLLQTNSPQIEGSETGWELTYYEFFFKNYTMTAESRMVNTWAFIVAGLIFILALAGMVTSLMRRKR